MLLAVTQRPRFAIISSKNLRPVTLLNVKIYTEENIHNKFTFRNFTQTINIETIKKETYYIVNLCCFHYKVY